VKISLYEIILVIIAIFFAKVAQQIRLKKICVYWPNFANWILISLIRF